MTTTDSAAFAALTRALESIRDHVLSSGDDPFPLPLPQHLDELGFLVVDESGVVAIATKGLDHPRVPIRYQEIVEWLEALGTPAPDELQAYKPPPDERIVPFAGELCAFVTQAPSDPSALGVLRLAML